MSFDVTLSKYNFHYIYITSNDIKMSHLRSAENDIGAINEVGF